MPHADAPMEITVRIARSDAQRARIADLRARCADRRSARGCATNGNSHRADPRLRSGGAPSAADPDEPYDRLPNAVLLLAESTFDGEILGSLRILAGDRGPLTIDARAGLSSALANRSVAEASRLVVRRGRGAGQIRRMLWKAWYRYSAIAQLDAMLACVPRGMARRCEALGMIDITPEIQGQYGNDSHAANRRLMRLDVAAAADGMIRRQHPWRTFFVVDAHPGIDLIGRSERFAGPSARPAGHRGVALPASAPLVGLAVV